MTTELIWRPVHLVSPVNAIKDDLNAAVLDANGDAVAYCFDYSVASVIATRHNSHIEGTMETQTRAQLIAHLRDIEAKLARMSPRVAHPPKAKKLS